VQQIAADQDASQELGKKVGLINAGTIGGTCVNVGCVPSKTLIRAAEAWHNAGHHHFCRDQFRKKRKVPK
jgi:pyruvate/2-oxoglutarate dehydrogenase complex dihydrolipoamide dehydrogenase (E3) component